MEKSEESLEIRYAHQEMFSVLLDPERLISWKYPPVIPAIPACPLHVSRINPAIHLPFYLFVATGIFLLFFVF